MKTLSPVQGDNTPQIQAALDSGEKVCLESGVYECESALVLTRAVHSGSGLWGRGAWLDAKSELYFTDPDDAGIICVGEDTQTAIVNFFDLQNVALVGPGKTESAVAHALHIESTTEPRDHASAGIVVTGCRIAEWSGCGVRAPVLWQSSIRNTLIENCGEHGLIVGGAPNLDLIQVFVRYCDGTGIWLQDGRPVLLGNDIGAVARGVHIGRIKNHEYFAGTPLYDAGGYCWPYMVDTHIEPFSDVGLYFDSGSMQSAIYSVRMYAAEYTAVEDGIRYYFLAPYSGAAAERFPYGEIRDANFLTKQGGCYTRKIRASGTNHTDPSKGKIRYFGPMSDVATDTRTRQWIKSGI